MKLPLIVTFAGIAPRASLEALIRGELRVLDPLAGRIVDVRVHVDVEAGEDFGAVGIDLGVTEGHLIAAQPTPSLHPRAIRTALRDALATALAGLSKLDAGWGEIQAPGGARAA